eukprot:1153112-Pelagomonas_calceolata.AAC.3
MQGIRVAHGHSSLPSASPKPFQVFRTPLTPRLYLRHDALPFPPPLRMLQATGGQQQPAIPSAGSVGGPATPPREEKPPLQQRILNGVLGISNVPYRSVEVLLACIPVNLEGPFTLGPAQDTCSYISISCMQKSSLAAIQHPCTLHLQDVLHRGCSMELAWVPPRNIGINLLRNAVKCVCVYRYVHAHALMTIIILGERAHALLMPSIDVVTMSPAFHLGEMLQYLLFWTSTMSGMAQVAASPNRAGVTKGTCKISYTLSLPGLCSSYVPAPATFLHRVDARIKQCNVKQACGPHLLCTNTSQSRLSSSTCTPASVASASVPNHAAVAGGLVLHDCASDACPAHWHRFDCCPDHDLGVPPAPVAVPGTSIFWQCAKYT